MAPAESATSRQACLCVLCSDIHGLTWPLHRSTAWELTFGLLVSQTYPSEFKGILSTFYPFNVVLSAIRRSAHVDNMLHGCTTCCNTHCNVCEHVSAKGPSPFSARAALPLMRGRVRKAIWNRSTSWRRKPSRGCAHLQPRFRSWLIPCDLHVVLVPAHKACMTLSTACALIKSYSVIVGQLSCDIP